VTVQVSAATVTLAPISTSVSSTTEVARWLRESCVSTRRDRGRVEVVQTVSLPIVILERLEILESVAENDTMKSVLHRSLAYTMTR